MSNEIQRPIPLDPTATPRVAVTDSSAKLLEALQREAWTAKSSKAGEAPMPDADHQHKGLTSMVPFSDIEHSLKEELGKAGSNPTDPNRVLDIADWYVNTQTIKTLERVLPGGDLKVSLLKGLDLATQCNGGDFSKLPTLDDANLAQQAVKVLNDIRDGLQARRNLEAETTRQLQVAKRGGENLPGVSDGIARLLKPLNPEITGKTVQNGLLFAGVAMTTVWFLKKCGWLGGDRGEDKSFLGAAAQLGVVAFTLSGLAEKAVNDGRSGFAMLGDSVMGAAHAADDVTLDLMRPENALDALKRLGLNNSKYTQEISSTFGVGFPAMHKAWKEGKTRTDKYHGQIRANELGIPKVPGLQDKELFELSQMLISGFPQLLLERGELSPKEAAMVRNGDGDKLIEGWYCDKTLGQLYMDFLLGHRPKCREADVDKTLELEVGSNHINMLVAVRDHLTRETGGALTPAEGRFSAIVTSIAGRKILRDTKEPANSAQPVKIEKAQLLELQALLGMMFTDYYHDVQRWAKQPGMINAFHINALNGISPVLKSEMLSLKSYLDGHFAPEKVITIDLGKNPEVARGVTALTGVKGSVDAIKDFSFDGSKKLKDFLSIKRYIRYFPGVDYATHNDDLAAVLTKLGTPTGAAWRANREDLKLLTAVLTAMSVEGIVAPTELKDETGAVITATSNPAKWAQFQNFVALHATLTEFARSALQGSTEARIQLGPNEGCTTDGCRASAVDLSAARGAMGGTGTGALGGQPEPEPVSPKDSIEFGDWTFEKGGKIKLNAGGKGLHMRDYRNLAGKGVPVGTQTLTLTGNFEKGWSDQEPQRVWAEAALPDGTKKWVALSDKIGQRPNFDLVQ